MSLNFLAAIVISSLEKCLLRQEVSTHFLLLYIFKNGMSIIGYMSPN